MHGLLLELLHRLVTTLDLLYDCSKDDSVIWTLISEIIQDMHSLSLAIEAYRTSEKDSPSQTFCNRVITTP
mgnify:CR=1 FL=1